MIIMSFQLENRSGTMPRYIGIIVFIAALGDIALSLFRGKKNADAEEKASAAWGLSPGAKRLLVLVALMVGYIIGLHLVGYIISSLLMVFLTMQILGVENKLLKFLGPVVTVGIMYLFFAVLLRIALPVGLLFS